MPQSRREFLLSSGRYLAGGSLLGPMAFYELAKKGPSLLVEEQEPPSAPFDDAQYWSFADRLAAKLMQGWSPDESFYLPATVQHNAEMLTAHALAAVAGHRGETRNDERALALATRLCQSPPWVDSSSQMGKFRQAHAPGWAMSMVNLPSSQHASIDPKVAEALAHAWRARDIIRLSADTVALIEDRITRVAWSQFFRYPRMLLSQINWNADLYAHAYTVSGDSELLVGDYRKQLVRFVEGIKRPLYPGGSTFLGKSYRFQYLCTAGPSHRYNLDSPEYANIVIHALIHYNAALEAGMRPLDDEQSRHLRAWAERAIHGYWTHGGYLNWDTGLGYKRWHWGLYWAFAMQGLLAIASGPRIGLDSKYAQWAKYFLDRGLTLHERITEGRFSKDGLLPDALYGVRRYELGRSMRLSAASRMVANAARAAGLGLGKKPAREPPPLFSFDPDIGRLAVTTPAYSTAVLATNRGALPYGGVELARLYDGNANALANIGAQGMAAFGVVVTAPDGRVIFSSQRPAQDAGDGDYKLALTESPLGEIKSIKERRPYVASFSQLEATGVASAGGIRAETSHLFKQGSITISWKVAQVGPGSPRTVDILFPSLGEGAIVVAALTSGKELRLAAPGVQSKRLAMAGIHHFQIKGLNGGYRVFPLGRSQGSFAHILRPDAQRYLPKPGPTLAINISRDNHFEEVSFKARIEPGINL